MTMTMQKQGSRVTFSTKPGAVDDIKIVAVDGVPTALVFGDNTVHFYVGASALERSLVAVALAEA